MAIDAVIWGAPPVILVLTLLVASPIARSRRDEHRKIVVHDMPGTWADFTDSVRTNIERERAGAMAPAGTLSWDEHWGERMAVYREDPEHTQMYVDYIVRSRERAGLPEVSCQR